MKVSKEQYAKNKKANKDNHSFKDTLIEDVESVEQILAKRKKPVPEFVLFDTLLIAAKMVDANKDMDKVIKPLMDAADENRGVILKQAKELAVERGSSVDGAIIDIIKSSKALVPLEVVISVVLAYVEFDGKVNDFMGVSFAAMQKIEELEQEIEFLKQVELS